MKTKVILFPALLLMMACSDPGVQKTEQAEAADIDLSKETMDSETGDLNDTTKYKFDFALANIPSPAGAVQDMTRYGVELSGLDLHDPGRAAQYNSEFTKAINLGIYNVDMSYVMMSNRGQEVLDYLKAVFVLSEDLGVRQAVQGIVGKRAEQNINNKDSLLQLLDEIMMKSDNYLRNNKRVYTASLIFAGGWVESLYLITDMAGKTSDAEAKKKMKRQLWEQRFYLKNLIDVLKDFTGNNECVKLVTDLRNIHQQIVPVKIDTDMSDETFSKIAGDIKALRGKYTEAQG